MTEQDLQSLIEVVMYYWNDDRLDLELKNELIRMINLEIRLMRLEDPQ